MTSVSDAPQNNNDFDHRAFWSTKQLRQRYGNITAKSIKRYQEVHSMPEPVRVLGMNLYSIPEILAWETKLFGFTVFPKNWDQPHAVDLPKIINKDTTQDET